MRVLVLGAGGFLGSRLVAGLVASGRVAGRPIDELVLFDLRPVSLAVAGNGNGNGKVTPVHGDLRDPQVLDHLFAHPVDVVFHLAATLTLDAEADFRRGLETNVLSMIELLERCRAQARAPMLLFASSISTFGGKLPAVVDDDVFQAPATSYGTHKVVTELLLADYSRHGFVDGRALRLPIVVTHPGPASGSISDQVSALIREPARGQPMACRMAPDSPMAVVSVQTVVASFLRLADLPEDAIRSARTMNQPGLTVTPAELTQAVGRCVGDQAGGLVSWAPDLKVQNIVAGWPRVFTSQRALALGIGPDISADALVSAFIQSERTPT
jgi:nucleoside-diphosphate-sugar epimerase